jgi:predicted amidohydrolase YtcJ
VRDSDLFRYKKLGVIPSMQPTHCTTDLLVVEDRIGKEYAKQGYRWNSFVKTGSILAFGTDWPIEPLDPRRGLYSAIERKNIENGQNKEEWFPEEDISIIEAIKSYTFGSAYASFNEHRIGSIEKGKLADLTVFDGNLLEIAKSNQRKILSIQIYMTIVNGKIVYKK